MTELGWQISSLCSSVVFHQKVISTNLVSYNKLYVDHKNIKSFEIFPPTSL